MYIDQLKYFLIACESRSFSAAAKAAFTSRQNLTRAIEMLEQELGVTLFLRGRDGVILTYQGEIAKAKAQLILADVSDLMNSFYDSDEDDESQKISVALVENFTSDISINLDDLMDFPINFTECSFRRCYDLVSKGDLDLALVISMERDFPKCNATMLGRIPSVVMFGEESSLADFEQICMKDLQGHRLILSEDSENLYGKFLSVFDSLAMPGSSVQEIASVRLMERELKRKNTATITTSSYIPSANSSGLATRPWENSEYDYCVYALHRGTRNALINAIMERVRALVAERSAF